MALRISKINTSSQSISLLFEGQVMGAWVAEAREVCERILADGLRLSLDLSLVSFASNEAIGFFQDINRRGAALVNCSPLVAEQLKDIASSKDDDGSL